MRTTGTAIIVIILHIGLSAPAADFAGGTGEPNDPYQIATAEQLTSIGSDPNLLDKHFVLINDIDLDPNLPGGRVFTQPLIAFPPRQSRDPSVGSFTGSFNGAGHAIRHMVLRAIPTYYLGLFGHIGKGGIVRDLRIEAADIKAWGPGAGILSGVNVGRVINCQAAGRLSGYPFERGPSDAGGLVGQNRGDIVDCQADTDLVWGRERVGGLVGTNDLEGRISGCHATCNHVYAWRMIAGGLVGANGGYIVGSSATGAVRGWELCYDYGGLVGRNFGNIINCHADSTISTLSISARIGGLVGTSGGSIINCYARGSIGTQERCSSIGGLIGENLGSLANSYACAAISALVDNKNVGGLIGEAIRGEVTMSFWDVEASGVITSAAGEGLTTAQMQQADTFLEAGWDFVDESANGIADAWRMPEGGGYPVLTLGSDEYDAPALPGEGTRDSPYQVDTPEDLGAMWRHDPSACYRLTSSIDLSGVPWLTAPIPSFNGTFDGAGFVIANLAVHGRTAAGVFGSLGSGATILNLGVVDANIVGGEGAQKLGALAGEKYGGDVVGCYATGRVSGGSQSSCLGGLIGLNYSGSLVDCYATTDVSCGPNSSGVGGLLGSGIGTILRSYAAGHMAAADPNETCGGLFGSGGNAVIANCYFLVDSDGGGPDNGLGIPLTSAEMKRQASFIDWDFENSWTICEGRDYPRLWWEDRSCEP